MVWQYMPAKIVDGVFGFNDLNRLRNNINDLRTQWAVQHLNLFQGMGHYRCSAVVGASINCNNVSTPTLLINTYQNIANVVRAGVGIYTVTLNVSMPVGAAVFADIGTVALSTGQDSRAEAGVTGPNVITIWLYSNASALTDYANTHYVSLIAYAQNYEVSSA